MPFKPRILRYDEAHAAVPAPLARTGIESTGSAPQADASPFDTVAGMDFSTLRDLPVDEFSPEVAAAPESAASPEADFFAADEQLGMLAQQLSADAARLATVYPADESRRWSASEMREERAVREPAKVQPAVQVVERRRSAVREFCVAHWHRMAAAALLVALAGGNLAYQHSLQTQPAAANADERVVPLNHVAANSIESSNEPTLDRSRNYAHGSTGIATGAPIGQPRDTLPDGLPADIWSPSDAGMLRDLGPDDSQDFCEVSM